MPAVTYENRQPADADRIAQQQRELTDAGDVFAGAKPIWDAKSILTIQSILEHPQVRLGVPITRRTTLTYAETTRVGEIRAFASPDDWLENAIDGGRFIWFTQTGRERYPCIVQLIAPGAPRR